MWLRFLASVRQDVNASSCWDVTYARRKFQCQFCGHLSDRHTVNFRQGLLVSFHNSCSEVHSNSAHNLLCSPCTFFIAFSISCNAWTREKKWLIAWIREMNSPLDGSSLSDSFTISLRVRWGFLDVAPLLNRLVSHVQRRKFNLNSQYSRYVTFWTDDMKSSHRESLKQPGALLRLPSKWIYQETTDNLVIWVKMSLVTRSHGKERTGELFSLIGLADVLESYEFKRLRYVGYVGVLSPA